MKQVSHTLCPVKV